MNKKLFIAYYYTPDDRQDTLIFVATEGKEYTEFKKYAKKQWDMKIKDEDIEGVYHCTIETDWTGKPYEIILKAK